MRKGGISYNGIEDEIRCPKCGYFFTSIRPALSVGQRILVQCRKCECKTEVMKLSASG